MMWWLAVMGLLLARGADATPGVMQRCGHSPSINAMGKSPQASTVAAVDNRVLHFNLTMHVFEDTKGHVVIPPAAVDAQFAHLQAVFARSQIQLAKSTIRYRDEAMSTNCLEYKSAAQALALEHPARSLHVFVCKLRETSGVLGYAQLPCSTLTPFTPTVFDGVAWVDYRTLPLVPGSFPYFDLGNTMVHELGHVLGLLHTFHTESCLGEGDLVQDTPTERGAFQGRSLDDCEAPDSCPLLPGRDSVQNYMNYSPDPCMTEFTPGQTQRMKQESERCLQSRFATNATINHSARCASLKGAKPCSRNPHCQYLVLGRKVPARCRKVRAGCRARESFCRGLCAQTCRSQSKRCQWSNKQCVNKVS